MSEAIISGVIQKLVNFVLKTDDRGIDYLNPIITNINEKEILKEVIKELGMMLDFLRDMKSGERSRLNHLLADFAEMAQDSADLTRNIGKNYFVDEMRNALNRLRKTKKCMMEFGVGKGISIPKSVGDEGVVVGLEKDLQQLTGRVILNEESCLLILSIKGMIGVGKTTLARQVYNHAAIVEKFKHRAWVSTSSDTSMHEVLVELIQKLVELDGYSLVVEKMDNRSLRRMLRRLLQEISYFIVLDNLLPQMRVESFFDSFPDQENGSRLLLVSRHEITKTNIYYTHQMKALDSDKSWKLFLKTIDKVISEENKFTKELEKKGKEMLKKCGGLPLAIIDVARQKAKQRLSGIEWEELFESVDLSNTLKLLEPMYHELDEDLQPCFLQMSLFKENAIMRDEKLEQIWSATGLNTTRNSTDRLVGQSIIEVANEPVFLSETKRYFLNPLLHMLSIKYAEEKMGFEIFRGNGNSKPSQNPRHRVIQCGRDKFNHSTKQDSKNLISLIFHGGGGYLDDVSPSYWSSFELLKILDMEDFGAKSLCESIGTLIELRYLGVRNNYIQEIPHSLGGLKKLEVFDIAQNFMVEVPEIIKEMGSLRHLYMSDVILWKPLKIDVLQNLETLTCISIYDWTYDIPSLKWMYGLLKLGIEEVDENMDAGRLFASLAKLESLDHLMLRGFRFRNMPCLDEIGVLYRLWTVRLDGRLSRLPSADNFPPCICYLDLVNTCLDEDPMPVLEKLSSLGRLKLRNAYTGREMVIRHGRFPKLQVLCINELWNLRNLWIGKGAMLALKELDIKNCPCLDTLPEEIGSMKYLKKLKMVTTKRIATTIRNSTFISKIVVVDISP